MSTEEFQRKLTAILSADVQGYSRLMEEDEDSTIRTLTSYRALMSSLIKSHRGYVVDTPGDNLLAEFGSVMDAVRCAVEIQEELRIRNADLPENRKMRFRIGINMGDIIEDGDHIYGDGVNIAARVEGLAEGGGICISGTVYDAIRNRLSMSYEFMGEHVVKNIKELVRIYKIRVEPEGETEVVKEKKARLRKWQWAALSVVGIIILGAVSIWYFSFRQEPVVSDVEEGPKTIAVLPFVNMSSDPDQEYFADGLSEEILNSLTKIPELIVTSRTSAFSFKDKDKTVQEIASVLGVGHILEGSVRKSGNALRITAQLIRAEDDRHLWSNQYDRELKDIEDILSIQEDIAKAVANELKVALGVGESLMLLGGTDNVEAYELYLAAKGQFNGTVGELTANVLEPLDEALALDPHFALAWVLKAGIISALSVGLPANQVDAMIIEGTDAIQKAIEIEPNLPDIYSTLGTYKTAWGEWIDAELNYRKASELIAEPSLKYKAFFALHYFAVGDFVKAYELLELDRRNDPLNPVMRGSYLSALGLLGNIDQADKEYELGIAMFGDEWWWGKINIAFVRIAAGEIASRDEIKIFWPIGKDSWDQIASSGDAIAELKKFYTDKDSLSSGQLQCTSICAAYFGEPEFALDAIVESIMLDHTSTGLFWYPVMHEVRQLPRFKEFVREIGLVDYWNEFGWPDICRPLGNGDFECD